MLTEIRPGDECKEFGSPPERPRPPPSSSKRSGSKRSGFDSPPYTPVRRPHNFADLPFRDPPRPQPEGSDEGRAKGKLKALASDKGDSDGKEADSDGKEADSDGKEADSDGKEADSDGEDADSDGKEESSSSSQSSRAAQGGSVQHEGSKGASKRIGPRGPISAAKGVDSC